MKSYGAGVTVEKSMHVDFYFFSSFLGDLMPDFFLLSLFLSHFSKSIVACLLLDFSNLVFIYIVILSYCR